MVFRRESINLILIKDFVCATAITFSFQYINLLYQNLFTNRNYANLATKAEQIAVI